MEKNDLIKQFQDANAVMDALLKSLNSFLEIKRQAFPRFYFLSNREVLDILAVDKDPIRIQPLLRKCFDGMHSLDIQENQVVAMIR